MIQFEHVCKSYGKTPILKDLNCTIQDGQFVVLIGPSGCGRGRRPRRAWGWTKPAAPRST